MVGRIAHAQAEDQFQILPMEELGLFKMGRSQPECCQPLGEDVLGVSTDLRNGPQQQLVTPRLGIVGDDLDDFEAVVDQKLLVFPIVVDGEQGIALIGSEIN